MAQLVSPRLLKAEGEPNRYVVQISGDELDWAFSADNVGTLDSASLIKEVQRYLQNLEEDIVSSQNDTFTLGDSSSRFHNVYVSDQGIRIGTSRILLVDGIIQIQNDDNYTFKLTDFDSARTIELIDSDYVILRQPDVGPQGPQGTQGIQGDSGPDGFDGLSVQGTDGERGDQGLQGPQGLPGLQGERGFCWPNGDVGEKGLQGIQGDPGPDGLLGNRGTQGADAAGTPGPTGDSGPQGIQGPPGFDNEIASSKGPQGIQGDSGPQGFTGAQGARGCKGCRGAQGVQGPQGFIRSDAQGTRGPLGPRGAQGPPGEKGACASENNIVNVINEVIYACGTATTLLIPDLNHTSAGNRDTFLGTYAGDAFCGGDNTYIGRGVPKSTTNTNMKFLTALGTNLFNNSCFEQYSVAIGTCSGCNTVGCTIDQGVGDIGCGNVYIGCRAGNRATAIGSVFVGTTSGPNTGERVTEIACADDRGPRLETAPPYYRHYVGIGFRSAGGDNTKGSISIGFCANSGTPAGGYGSIAIGTAAGWYMTACFQVETQANVYIGKQAGWYSCFTCRNISIGSESLGCLYDNCHNISIGPLNAFGRKLCDPGSDNNIYIGLGARPTSQGVSNEIVLGGSAICALRSEVTSITSLSDCRDKSNIQNLNWGADFIDKMRPVRFEWDRRDSSYNGYKDIGFISQELRAIESNLSSFDLTRLTSVIPPVDSDEYEKIEADPLRTYPIMIQALIELNNELDQLEAEVDEYLGV